MKAILVILLLLFPLTMIPADDQEPEGDDKILEAIRRIQEEEEEQEEEETDSWDEDDGDTCAGCDIGCEIFGELFGELFWEYILSLRFAPYPYAEQSAFRYSTLVFEPGEPQKFASLQSSADLSVHFDGTYGNCNRLSAQLSALHFNLFNQILFSSSEFLSVLSVNGGLSLVIGSFDLSAFAGVYKPNIINSFSTSMGLSSRLFLPGGLYLDVYNLNAFLGDTVRFIHLAASLNYSIWRFSIGLGYNYSNIVDIIFKGPCFKVSFWL
jgi:hypothetical protein